MREQKAELAAQADSTVAEQLTLEVEAEALRRALANDTSPSAPTGASPAPELEQANRTSQANDTTGVSPGRHLRGANGIPGAIMQH